MIMKKFFFLATLFACAAFLSSCGDDDEPVTPVTPTHSYVEIGGLRWSTMNLGATTVAGSPATSYGDYYAWGETKPRYTSIVINGLNSVSFGGWMSEHGNGYADSDLPTYAGETLDAANDAATVNWGSTWRTPSKDDFMNLTSACTGSTGNIDISPLSSSSPAGGIYWLSSTQTYLSDYIGVAGILFVDRTDTSKRLFFPATGICFDTEMNYGGTLGYYWSSVRFPNMNPSSYQLYFSDLGVGPSNYYGIYYGCAIRPVSDIK